MSSWQSQSHTENNTPVVIMYTDGACIFNPGPGGWAALLREVNAAQVASELWQDILVLDERCKILAGSTWGTKTTNQRMEVIPAIKGLEALRLPCSVQIRSDSDYLVKTMTPSENWKRRTNLDLWDGLERAVARHYQVTFEHVRGHSGDTWNDVVDREAKAAARRSHPSTEVPLELLP